MSTPQQVTERYIRNLIVKGKNDDFEIKTIQQQIAVAGNNIPVGTYYQASIMMPRHDFKEHLGLGPTVTDAVSKALQAAGVTLR